jgi:hypothetical protein
MDKTVILKTFNDHFIEFLDDISRVFPDDPDVATTKTALLAIRKANPRLIIQSWKEYVVAPYRKKIDDGDMSFFIEKDFSHDLRDVDGNSSILDKIDTLRDEVRSMTKDDQVKAMKYVQNLTKLSDMYM